MIFSRGYCQQKLATNSLLEKQAHLPATVNITLGMSFVPSETA